MQKQNKFLRYDSNETNKFQSVGLISLARPLKYAKMASRPGCHFYIFTLGKYCSTKSTFST